MKIIKELIPYIIITIVVVLIRIFVVSPVSVDGNSMYPTLKNKEYLLLNKYDKSYERFDIVVLKYGKDELVKRVIGLPGEHIEYKNSVLYVNGKKVSEKFIDATTDDYDISLLGVNKIPDNYYFVVGDNRNNSMDSRIIGFINKKDILGSVKISISKFKKVK